MALKDTLAAAVAAAMVGARTDETRPIFSPLLHTSRFRRAQVCHLVGCEESTLHTWLARAQKEPTPWLLSTLGHLFNPGTESKRLFSGMDVLVLSAIQAASPPYPVRKLSVLLPMVVERVTEHIVAASSGVPLPGAEQLLLLWFDQAIGDYRPLRIQADQDMPDPDHAVFLSVLRVDQLIANTLLRLHTFCADDSGAEPLPRPLDGKEDQK